MKEKCDICGAPENSETILTTYIVDVNKKICKRICNKCYIIWRNAYEWGRLLNTRDGRRVNEEFEIEIKQLKAVNEQLKENVKQLKEVIRYIENTIIHLQNELEKAKCCGSCRHGQPLPIDTLRCYSKGTPYLPVGLAGKACDKWEVRE